MRFKAKLTTEQVTLFHSILIPLTKLSSSSSSGVNVGVEFTNHNNNNTAISSTSYSIVSLENEYMKLSSRSSDSIMKSTLGTSDSSSHSSGGIICYSEIPIRRTSSSSHHYHHDLVLFDDHRIESTAPNNRIVMEIDLHQLKLAFKSILGSSNNTTTTSNNNTMTSFYQNHPPNPYTVIKLAKRQNRPCLCIDGCIISNTNSNKKRNRQQQSVLDGTSSTTTYMNVHYAIPIRIIRADDFEKYYIPPIVSLPDIQFEIYRRDAPWNNIPWKHIIDRLKHISPILYLEATFQGTCTIRLNTEGTSIRMYCNQLQIRTEGCKDTATTMLSSSQLSSTSSATISPLNRSNKNNKNDENHQPNPPSSNHSVSSNRTNHPNHPPPSQLENNKNKKPMVVKVDTKKLLACLHWQPNPNSSSNSTTTTSSSASLQPISATGSSSLSTSTYVSSALLCFICNEMMVLHVTLYPIETGFITYYIPIHYVSTEEDDENGDHMD
jgi:HUS1 checkpoint protein